MAALARWVRWRQGAGRQPGRWRPRRVLVVVAAALVGVMVVGVSAVLIGQRGGSAGYDEGAAGVGTSAASPVAPSSPMETAPAPAAAGRAGAADSAAAPNSSSSSAGSAGQDKGLTVTSGRDLIRSAQLTLDVDDVSARARQ